MSSPCAATAALKGGGDQIMAWWNSSAVLCGSAGALDWCSTNFYKNYSDLWYPVAGFGPCDCPHAPSLQPPSLHASAPQCNRRPPADYPEACTKALANLAKFEAQFLSSGKFITGDVLSIADYKVASWFWYLDFPAVQEITGFVLPARCKQYVADFKAASKSFDGLHPPALTCSLRSAAPCCCSCRSFRLPTSMRMACCRWGHATVSSAATRFGFCR